MIKSLIIDNFKSLEKSGELDIAPITLIMGPNSSGKSSILKPLLLMKQTADSRDLQRSVQVDGSYVELGPYHDFVFNHDCKRSVKFPVFFSLSSERHVLANYEKKYQGKKQMKYFGLLVFQSQKFFHYQ